MSIIGQTKIINRIKRYTLDTFPKSLILVGDYGSGKHTLVDCIATYFNLTLIDITDKISLEYINNIVLNPNPYIYLINGTNLSIKSENVLLKFLEEPPKSAFIVILCEHKQQLIDTILSRCRIWNLEPYSSSDLMNFSLDENILSMANTPGLVIKLKSQDIGSIINLCNTIIDKISNANFANVLTIRDKINFGDEEDKIDLRCFILVMINILSERLKNINIEDRDYYIKLMRMYKETNDFYNSIYKAHVNKKLLFDNYITELKLL